MDILDQIKKYEPYNEQEEHDKVGILNYLKQEKNIFSRDNKIAHMTASAWVVNKDRNKVVMIYHNIYNSWSWMGGHADGEEDLFAVAIKEVQEESGLNKIIPISKDIFSLEILTVDGHIKKGEYVSSHLHLNITYLFEADEKEILTIKADENSGVEWFELDESIDKSTEVWFKERIYAKLNKKLNQL
ncbi:NUDIX hydrolase [Fusobacteria bacterium ZRK30]|nr:NUDIX hydrolase [Fusobacteria bacterium ZRK30]